MISSKELKAKKNTGFEKLPDGLKQLLFEAEDMAAALTQTQKTLIK